MLPYGGTPIRDLLQKEGRLRGDLTHPDDESLDVRLNEYHRLLSQAVRPWIHNEGLSYQLSYAWDELETITRLIPGTQGNEAYRAAMRYLTKESNERLFRLVEESSLAFEQGDRSALDPIAVRACCEETRAR
jgi:anaerobic magnesium-protoporphyrin IX monomethyl ester cyclase